MAGRKSSEPLEQRVDRYIATKNGKRLGPVGTFADSIAVRCKSAHQFSIKPRAMLYLHRWCARCSNQASNAERRWSQTQLNELALGIGGQCLTSDYRDAHQRLKWECSNGHTFEESVSSFKVTMRCPVCYQHHILQSAIEKRRVKASSACEVRGGRLLAFGKDVATGASVATVECSEGHTWRVSYTSLVTAGSWCQQCHLNSMVANRSYHKRLTIDHFRKLAQERGGRCLSTSYSGVGSLLDYKCANGHLFSQLAGVTNLGCWCPTCAISERADKKRASIQEIRAEASRRGGSCLSTSYDVPRAPLEWHCGNPDHSLWKARWHKVKLGQWCPQCASGFGERVARLLFQDLFQTEFPKVRPRWLKSPKRGLLELDGYNEGLRVAFEHHGRQHYSRDRYYMKSSEDLRYRKELDGIKRERCEEQGIVLIEIPEIGGILPLDKVADFVISRLDAERVAIPRDLTTYNFNWYPAFAGRSFYRARP